MKCLNDQLSTFDMALIIYMVIYHIIQLVQIAACLSLYPMVFFIQTFTFPQDWSDSENYNFANKSQYLTAC